MIAQLDWIGPCLGRMAEIAHSVRCAEAYDLQTLTIKPFAS
jgi:hypothetical protein